MIDILVLGATGFTGRLITEVLQTHRERPSFSFGIAGRSQSKLAKLKKDLKLDDSVQIFDVDVTSEEQVEGVVSQAAVVINAVGPYWIYGTTVVKACVKLERHYVDLTGESYWVKEIINKFDYVATTKGCTIIPSCGLDSLPSDLAVYLSNRTLKGEAGLDANIDTSTTAVKMDSTISPGTLGTLISFFEQVPRHVKQNANKPFYLSNVPGGENPPIRLTYSLPHTKPAIYGGFFPLAGGNRAIVQRSWGLREYDLRKSSVNPPEDKRKSAYGPDFKYDEFLVTATWTSGLLLSLGFAFTVAFMFLPPVRWIAKKFLSYLPEGPSEHHKKNGRLVVTNVTSSTAAPGTPPVHVRTIIKGQGEAGYYLTSYMITECALALLLSRPELPELGREGGVLTPTTALGDVLVRRLEESGKFTFHSEVFTDEDEDRKTR
ncbi:Saccharopine dehydrogenase-domain-containing protein [Cristinia sonorae]|uniref:Saccharopine dehydrogenase-domain-containing protein n=1 Tax=Cristinia sonorae TaxID=1940300 RepID=A0A8K0UTZ0_9AGAR|nr:Saccharopine dehydrogenase-domain-containing protein [Cristinia sonorae]